ncbi:hypothetical protein Acid345_0937 [Candidatus Koribacter versatilis Ellin345]|uniref:Transmembrane protein n=1 Tax=Koribacter versatilis (strain Ellin345) TaxID=204669 RepID=Q1IT60_KORVE|nr:YfiR family protein [Candidatus Koribacter versatilis]ABF39940.1 hypothetical protein Acid345_0937 [Candidatus Koribacter versatilis Ellin345]
MTNLSQRRSSRSGAKRTSSVRDVLRCLVLLPLFHSLLAMAAPPAGPPTDLQVKAAYLYKFGAFVQWPASVAPSDDFSICVLGRDGFGSVLDSTINGESIEGKKLVALRVNSVREAAQCRILYISNSEESRLRGILVELAKAPVLTVSDIPHFADRGGMIEFTLQSGRVRFDVNVTRAERAGLTLSSQLLKVAANVKHDEARD